MRIVVTVKSFDNEMSQFDFLIPSMANTMERLIIDLISLEEPHINIDGLNAIYFTNDYREELFSFQESVQHEKFATKNKIADGYAQVVLVREGEGSSEEIGYHIFFSKFIPMAIMVGEYLERNADIVPEELASFIGSKNEYIRMIRHA